MESIPIGLFLDGRLLGSLGRDRGKLLGRDFGKRESWDTGERAGVLGSRFWRAEMRVGERAGEQTDKRADGELVAGGRDGGREGGPEGGRKGGLTYERTPPRNQWGSKIVLGDP